MKMLAHDIFAKYAGSETDRLYTDVTYEEPLGESLLHKATTYKPKTIA